MRCCRLMLLSLLSMTACTKTKAPDATPPATPAPDAAPQTAAPATPAPDAAPATPPTPPAPPAPPTPPALPPVADLSTLTQVTYGSDKGSTLTFFRDGVVELRTAKGVVRGAKIHIDGAKLFFIADGAAAETQVTLADAGKTITAGDPAETFKPKAALAPEGHTFTGTTGVNLKVTGKKGTFTSPDNKPLFVATDLVSANGQITYTDSRQKPVVKHTLNIENGGTVLRDVTPAQVAEVYRLNDPVKKPK